MTTRVRFLVPGYSLALTLAVTAPLLAPGYLLLRDAVSTPRSHLSDAALGIGESAPRAVPQDAAIAVASHLLDGGIVVKALLIAGLLLAGWGAARLAARVLPEAGTPGQIVAVTVAIWNPYVAERLLQGHWSLLVGYGALPWVAAAVIALRTAPRRGDWAALVFWIALAGLTPTGLILAALVGLVCVATPGPGVGRLRCGATVLVVAIAAASPWLVASALGDALGASQAEGLAPFAARAEPGLGTLGSLAGLGGIWNAEAVPPSRSTLFAAVATAVLLAIVVIGSPVAARRRAAGPLLVLAAVAVLIPAALATGPGLAALRAAVDIAPGLAVLRDGQKWVALAMPGVAVAAAAVVPALRGRIRPAVTATVCAAALIAVLPDLAWGAGSRVTPVHYPPAWPAVAALIDTDTAGAVAVLPAGGTRRFAWAGPAPVLDPLPRWVRADVLSTGDLPVQGSTVPGEGRHARDVERLLLTGAAPAALRDAGVRWVVVQRSPGVLGDSARTLAGLPVAYSDPEMTLYRVGGTNQPAPQRIRGIVLAAHLLWAAMLTVAALVLLADRRVP